MTAATNDIAVLSKCNSIATEVNIPEAGHAHIVERGNILKKNAEPEMQSVFDVNAQAECCYSKIVSAVTRV